MAILLRTAGEPYNTHNHQVSSLAIDVAQNAHGFAVGDLVCVTGADKLEKVVDIHSSLC